jgi:hypothetical protein
VETTLSAFKALVEGSKPQLVKDLLDEELIELAGPWRIGPDAKSAVE